LPKAEASSMNQITNTALKNLLRSSVITLARIHCMSEELIISKILENGNYNYDSQTRETSLSSRKPSGS